MRFAAQVIFEIVFERLAFADVQTTLGENGTQAAFHFGAHLFVAGNFGAQVRGLFGEFAPARFEFGGAFGSRGATFEVAYLAFERRDDSLQAFDLARQIPALVGEVLAAGGGFFGAAQRVAKPSRSLSSLRARGGASCAPLGLSELFARLRVLRAQRC